MEEREQLLRCCFLVMAADDEIDETESWLANRLAEELDIERPDLNAIRDEFHEQLSSVREIRRVRRELTAALAAARRHGRMTMAAADGRRWRARAASAEDRRNPGRTGRTTGRAATMSASVPAAPSDLFGTTTHAARGLASRLTAGFLFVTTGLVARGSRPRPERRQRDHRPWLGRRRPGRRRA